MNALLRRLAVVASLALSVGACSDVTGPTADLVRAKQRWATRAPDSYQLTVGVGCFCGDVARPVVVRVIHGEVVSRRYADTGDPVPAGFEALFPSVDELFSIIDQAIAAHADHLTAQYDPGRGFPVEVSIDRRFQIADDEVWYTMSHFEAL